MHALDSLFQSVLAAGLRASLITLVVLALQTLLRKQLDARWRYGLWLPVLVVLLMPVRTESRWSMASLMVSSDAPKTEAFAEAALPDVPKTALGGADILTQAPSRGIDWLGLMTMVWACGAVMLGVFSLLAYRVRLGKARRTSAPTDSGLIERIKLMSRKMGLRRVPRVCITSAVDGPAVCGLCRPTLLLDPDSLRKFDENEIATVLQHELTHIKRGDLWLHAVMCLLLALHWFNPILWLAFFRVRQDREAACDADVLRDASAQHRAAYGHTLLKVESAFPASGLCLGFVGMVQRGAALRSRIEMIITPPTTRLLMKTTLSILITALTFFGITKAADNNDNDDEPQIVVKAAFYQIPADAKLPEQNLLNMLLGKAQAGMPTAVLGVLTPAQSKSLYTELSQTAGVEMLATPSATTRSGRKATIEMSRDFVFPKGEKFETIKAGIELGLNARLAAKEPIIDLELEPVLSDVDDSVKPPKVIIQKVNTSVSLWSEQTLLLNLGTLQGKHTLRELSGAASRPETKNASYRIFLAISATAVDARGRPYVFPPNIEGKLKSIILPKVQFSDASIAEAIEFLRVKSRDLDISSPDEYKGINFVLKAGNKTTESPKLTLDLQNVPLGEVLRFVTQLANLQYQVTSHAVVIGADLSPAGDPLKIEANSITFDKKTGVATASGNVKIETTGGVIRAREVEVTPANAGSNTTPKAKGGDIILPTVEFRDAKLEEALEFIRVKSRDLDPAKQGVNILVKGAGNTASITMSLKNVLVAEALRYVAELSGLRLTVEKDTFVISPAEK
jgi:beta-lactamase regulating signal transducer with metallopeptidase domain